MIRITAITRERGLYTLWSDDEPAARLDGDAYRALSLGVGDEADESELAALTLQSEEKSARRKALNLLARRDYSRVELAEKLAQKVSPEAAERAAARMEELGLVNDASYAARLFADLTGRKGYAPSRALREMRQKGLDRETAEEALSSAEFNAVERLDALIARKYAKAFGSPEGERRVIAALGRLGYSYEDIRSALRRAAEET